MTNYIKEMGEVKGKIVKWGKVPAPSDLQIT